MNEERISRYNLLDEPWISVMVDYKGNTKEVSLIEFFKHAHEYKDFAGDMAIQDFAVMRFLLAILHTVFSRFNDRGEEYGYIKLDENFKPKNVEEKIDEDDEDEYKDDLMETWKNIWENKKFPEIIIKYLEKWRDRFYLFDTKYPFYQVIADDVTGDKINLKSPTKAHGKKINRLISESSNKIALFSPIIKKNKDILTESELVRWLITYQGCIGLDDKTIFVKEKYKSPSRGWIYDLGGLTLVGTNIFETLLLNCVLVHPEEGYTQCIQKPCWEYVSKEMLDKYLSNAVPNNLASLYTNWGRAIYINPNFDMNEHFYCNIVKLPRFEHRNFFLEPMTMWKYNDNKSKEKEDRDTFKARKHRENESIWRSFGLLTLTYKTVNEKGISKASHKPGIIQWINKVHEYVNLNNVSIKAVTMKDNGNSTSWIPTEEILDELRISDEVLVDENWIERINDVVEFTKEVVGINYKKFLLDIEYIRSDNGTISNKEVQQVYFAIDSLFKEWLGNININDDFEETIKKWKDILKKCILERARTFVKNAGNRDYLGKNKSETNWINIVTAYNKFKYLLNKKLNN